MTYKWINKILNYPKEYNQILMKMLFKLDNKALLYLQKGSIDNHIILSITNHKPLMIYLVLFLKLILKKRN